MPLPPPDLPCPIAVETRPWVAKASASGTSPAVAVPGTYSQALKSTPAGWPRRDQWCVWVEPTANHGPTGIWEQRWERAVLAALTTWRQHLPIQLVQDPAQAQVRVERRRPPIQQGRASHGRALLQLFEVQRDREWRLEPRVQVLISPGQAEPAIQATALHELGHAFGLWGHSDAAGDAMATKPGAQPMLQLSSRDLATLEWLQQQPALGSGEMAR